MDASLLEIVRNILLQYDEITLKEIYEIVKKQPDLKIESHLISQRVRTTIDYLMRHNEVERIDKGIYKKMITKK